MRAAGERLPNELLSKISNMTDSASRLKMRQADGTFKEIVDRGYRNGPMFGNFDQDRWNAMPTGRRIQLFVRNAPIAVNFYINHPDRKKLASDFLMLFQSRDIARAEIARTIETLTNAELVRRLCLSLHALINPRDAEEAAFGNQNMRVNDFFISARSMNVRNQLLFSQMIELSGLNDDQMPQAIAEVGKSDTGNPILTDDWSWNMKILDIYIQKAKVDISFARKLIRLGDWKRKSYNRNGLGGHGFSVSEMPAQDRELLANILRIRFRYNDIRT